MHRLTLIVIVVLFPAIVHADEPRQFSPEDTRKAFLKLLDRPKIDPDIKREARIRNEYEVEFFTFASEKKMDGSIERVTVKLVRPIKEGVYPAMIVLHGTGGSRNSVNSWLDDLAKRGIIGVAIDARYHGERSNGAKGSAAYVAAISKAWKVPKESMEHPFYYDTCWDLWRLVDVLEKRKDIDAKRIGMMGISMGGIQTWLAASVDERIAVAIPLIAVQSFRWSLENEKWQGRANSIKAAHETAAKDLGESAVNSRVCRELWNKVVPGILAEFDCPNMLRLFAGRPLLIANGHQDGNCPIGGARVAFKSVEDTYAKANAKDKLKILVAEGVGHKVTDEQRNEALAWCEKWLKR
jgi:pimeloyl-ACP methyl ester carboxylesterase